MTVTVVGSIAYDRVKTPFGERERMLGGAATHFALAASFFAPVHVVGVVGDDFEHLDALAVHGTDVSDVERVPGERTFFWHGEYGWDLNARTTHATELGAFASFSPVLSDEARAADVVFLANIQPGVQRAVLDQCDAARFVALDSMDLWIETEREALVEVIERVDCVILNDAELREVTRRPSLLAAGRELLSWGPRMVVAKLGEYGAALVTPDAFVALPAYPLEEVVDPTGAGDTFAGGFVGSLARHGLGDGALRRALAYGIGVASFNVEAFGTERVAELTAEEIEERVVALRRIVDLDALELAR